MERTEILADYKAAKKYKKSWIDQAKEDFDFVIGDQWDQKTLSDLKKAGKPALTLNKIQSLIFLISGIQRQNRTDYKSFPIGEEDTVKADSITYLLKDMMRNCDGEYKESEMFENGIICGEGWLEPYLDYGKDILNGDLMFRDLNPCYIFVDPSSKEYDHSDARFIVKYTPNISKEQILQLFPENEGKLNDIATKTISEMDDDNENVLIKYNNDYDTYNEDNNNTSTDKAEILDYDMIEYHCYKQEKVYLVVNNEDKSDYEQVKNEADAKYILEQRNTVGSYRMVNRFIMIPHVYVLVNGFDFDDFQSPWYPRYKKIPLFAFYAHKLKAPVKRHELLIQGIVNSLKDPQMEINKRRSQELHHLNTSSNSGWLNKRKGGISNRDQVQKYGASPGIIIDYDQEKPDRIFPQPLSSGHEHLVQESNKDIKEISGINTDLLAMNDKASSSGRAIHLRQQQGLMMIQRILDNFSRTKREIGRFLISQIGEVYDVSKMRRAIGEAWVKEHFSEPIMAPRKDPYTGQPMMNPQTGQPEIAPVMDESGKMVMEVNEENVQNLFKMILDDASVERYDVVIGEIATSETIKLANYTMVLELIQSGVPIPPDVIVDESTLSDSSKNKIRKSMAAMQAPQPKQGAAK